MFSTFTRHFSRIPSFTDAGFVKKEKTTTIRTSKSTQVDRTVKFIFPDGAEVSSKVTSKTTFSTRNSRRNHGNNQPYDAEATASLIEVVAATMAADAVRQAEQEIRVE